MSKAPVGVDPDELNVAARNVLLDALTALKDHRDALTVVGAQAVYLRTQEAEIRSAAYTSDGDISIDPAQLGDQPLLEQAMRDAGFSLRANQSGLWERPEQIGDLTVPVEVDLLVPHQLAPLPNKKRRTELPPHNEWATKKVPGLEVAAVDRSVMTLRSLTPDDNREVDAYVAGPAALLIAKAFKLDERVTEAEAKERTDRLSNKDAGDVFRIMAVVPVEKVAATFRALQSDTRVGEVAADGLLRLHKLFGGAATPGTELAVRALAGDVPERRIRALAPFYASALTS
ncbi:hypothetical protein ACIRU8_45465 [Streptomyces sp. NPDC101175]|uniref:hypothetical protein n=1 Tax=Streptomyces sp. NPDC101175 TaxID=3366123 RepID=UPI003835B9B5